MNESTTELLNDFDTAFEPPTTMVERLHEAWKHDHFAGQSELIRFEAIVRSADALERIAAAMEALTNER